MRCFLILIFTILITVPVYSQKKSERVKRKYRKVETVNRELPQVFLWGKVKNQDGEFLQGVSVVLIGSKLGVHTNTEGEYLLTGLSTGRLRFQASFIGFKTKYTDIVLQDGINELYFTLDKEKITVEPFISTSQKREEQILDIPSNVNIFTRNFINLLDVNQTGQLSDFADGANIRLSNSLFPVYTFRGITSENSDINIPPRISTLYNEVPINPLTGSSMELYDMERAEILKGPQQTAFGMNAEAGSISLISKKPTVKNEGYITARYGNFAQKTVDGALNIPILGEAILARAAGFYNYSDGYVINSFGGNLNGINKMGGRISLLIKPTIFTRFELEVNYQKDNEPGTAFIHPVLPNTFGEANIFGFRASLNEGDSLTNKKEIFNSILNARYYISEHTYLSSISSYQINSAYGCWDGDGTAANALNFSKDIGIKQFSQELRLNFTRNSKLNGFGGVSYLRENGTQLNTFSTNEQHLYHLFFEPDNLVGSSGQPNVVTEIPFDTNTGILAGTALPTNHQETRYLKSLNQHYDVFLDATLNVLYRLKLTGGLRVSYNWLRLTNANIFSAGSESVLGQITGFLPNILYNPTDTIGKKNSSLSMSYRAGFVFKFNPDASMYGNYSLGQRPKLIQFQNDGTNETIPSEKINNFELGFKGIFKSKFWIDVAGFYYTYSNFQSRVIKTDTTNNILSTYIDNDGKATVYGAEATIKYAVLKEVEFFGNYTWTKSKFNNTDNLGNEQELAGNQFKFTPEHSFSVGLHLSAPIGHGIELFATPTYLYKSAFFFDDANSENMKQEAYGILNAQFGLNLIDPNITFLVYANNILEEKYLLYSGKPGNSFDPTVVVPAPPRMVGTKLTWNFEMKKKPYYKRRRR
jgi:iron complex outermembrane recepter protein